MTKDVDGLLRESRIIVDNDNKIISVNPIALEIFETENADDLLNKDFFKALRLKEKKSTLHHKNNFIRSYSWQNNHGVVNNIWLVCLDLSSLDIPYRVFSTVDFVLYQVDQYFNGDSVAIDDYGMGYIIGETQTHYLVTPFKRDRFSYNWEEPIEKSRVCGLVQRGEDEKKLDLIMMQIVLYNLSLTDICEHLGISGQLFFHKIANHDFTTAESNLLIHMINDQQEKMILEGMNLVSELQNATVN